MHLDCEPHDDPHALAVFRARTGWGAVSKSNGVALRYRDPIYRSLRELALSYFHAPDRARPLLERVGGGITDLRWSYFKNPLGLLEKYRAAAGLPRLMA